MKKSMVMILGGGIFQLPLIGYAQDQGYKAIVCSNRSDDPGLQIADIACNVSTLNRDALLQVAKEHQVSAVLTTASELAVPTLGYLNDALGLKEPSEKQANLFANKWELKQLLQAKEIRIPAIWLKETAESRSYNCLQKPVFGGGSEFVEMHEAGTRVSNGFFLEAFIEGEEMGGDLIVDEGEVVFLQATRKRVNEHFVPIQHLIVDPPNTPTSLLHYLQEVITKLAIQQAIMNFDVMFDGTDYWLIDIGLRAGGNAIPELIQLSTGVNEYAVLLKQSLGQKTCVLPKCYDSFFGVHILGSTNAGSAQGYNQKAIKTLSDGGFLMAKMLRYGNEAFNTDTFTAGKYNVGYLLFKASTKEELLQVARNIAHTDWIEWQEETA